MSSSLLTAIVVHGCVGFHSPLAGQSPCVPAIERVCWVAPSPGSEPGTPAPCVRDHEYPQGVEPEHCGRVRTDMVGGVLTVFTTICADPALNAASDP